MQRSSVQTSSSSHSSGIPGLQCSAWQVSSPSQMLPSEHGVPSGWSLHGGSAQAELGPNESKSYDVAVMDDFLYAEPRPAG